MSKVENIGTLILASLVVAFGGIDAATGAGRESASIAPRWSKDIVLTIRDVANVERKAEPCSTGVPLPRGVLYKPEGLAVADSAGGSVPAQFKVLERWRDFGDDGSIRWLLVTFLADVPAGGTSTYTLKAGRNPLPRTPAKPVEGLGPFRLLLTRPDGKKLTDADLRARAELVESGPVRACVRLETPTSHEKFGYVAWVYTYAGGGRTDLSVVLKNTPNEPQGPFYFTEFSVAVAPEKLRGATRFMLGREPGEALAGQLADGEHVRLYQESDGTDRWDKLGTRRDWTTAYVIPWSKIKHLGLPTFRGYRVRAGERQLGEGNFALGWSAITGGGRAAALAVRHFRENYPSAVEVRRGQMTAHLWPAEWAGHGGLHWLDDLQRKRYDLSLRLVDGELTAADGDAMALAFNMPLVAHAGIDAYRAAGYASETAKLDNRVGPREYPQGYGSEPNWVTFGGDTTDRIKRRYHQYGLTSFAEGGNPWQAYRLMIGAYHSAGITPMYVDDYRYPRDAKLLTHAQYCSTVRSPGKYREKTGHHGYMAWNAAHFLCKELFDGWRLFGDPLAREAARDIATYLQFYVDFRKAGGKLVAGTRADGHPLGLLCEAYRIFGDESLKASAMELADVSFKQVDKRRGNYGVMANWEGGRGEPHDKPFMMGQVMNGLKHCYRLTHDERIADQIIGMTDFILAEAHLGPWGYTYVVKLADADKHAAFRQEVIDAVKKKPGAFRMQLDPKLVIFAYEQTGEAKYRDALSVLLPATYRAHGRNRQRYAYMAAAVNDIRPDSTPPAAVADLAAKPLGGGKVRLTWTTPTDAVRLQIKWSDKPMVERCWPDKADTHANWWAADHVAGEPAPVAGKSQLMVVTDVPAGTRHFAIRTYDQASNRSAISNIAKADVK